MKRQIAGRIQPMGLATLAFSLALLAGSAVASDVERRIPVTRDAAGSGLTMEISGEGTRRTATPFLTLNEPSVERIEEWIGKKAARLQAMAIDSGTYVADPVPGIGRTGATPEDVARPERTAASASPAPVELTVRGVKRFLKELRASRKETPTPAAVAPPAEQRLGRTDASRREAN